MDIYYTILYKYDLYLCTHTHSYLHAYTYCANNIYITVQQIVLFKIYIYNLAIYLSLL